MKIIQVHNYYQQAGGEDAVVAAEQEMLEKNGNVVVQFCVTNDEIAGSNSGVTPLAPSNNGRKLLCNVRHLLSLLNVSIKTIWNQDTYRKFRKLLRKEKPDVVHCHNTFPLISPSIYWACSRERIPVVQTLHNFRLACATPFFFRAGKQKHEKSHLKPNAKSLMPSAFGSICELCIGKSFPYPALRYRCYRQSFAATFVWSQMVWIHRLLGTYRRKVDCYIALTDFSHRKLIECGLPDEKIFVKPNFIQNFEDRDEDLFAVSESSKIQKNEIIEQQRNADNFFQKNSEKETIHDQLTVQIRRPYALFVGRLSSEKGCDVLIRAWHEFCKKFREEEDVSAPQLLIVGDGPELESLESLASSLKRSVQPICFLGKQSKEGVHVLMHDAQFLILPSLCYEGFPMTVLEAFSQSLPVLASNLGGLASIVAHKQNGLLFEPCSALDLSEKIRWAFEYPEVMERMGVQGKKDFELKYSAETNYAMLMDIYNSVIGEEESGDPV